MPSGCRRQLPASTAAITPDPTKPGTAWQQLPRHPSKLPPPLPLAAAPAAPNCAIGSKRSPTPILAACKAQAWEPGRAARSPRSAPARIFLRTCSASSCTLDPADSATSLNLSGNSAMMSSVWVPMEPVEPSTENGCAAGGVLRGAGARGVRCARSHGFVAVVFALRQAVKQRLGRGAAADRMARAIARFRWYQHPSKCAGPCPRGGCANGRKRMSAHCAPVSRPAHLGAVARLHLRHDHTLRPSRRRPRVLLRGHVQPRPAPVRTRARCLAAAKLHGGSLHPGYVGHA